MKKITVRTGIVLLVSFISIVLYAQPASPETYALAKLYLEKNSIEKLQAAGVYFDEGELVPGKYFTSVFSYWELAQAKKAGVRFDILFADATAEFEQRNAADMRLHPDPKAEASKQAAVNCDYPVPGMFNLGSMGGYLTYEEMLAALDTMHARFPELCSAKMPIPNSQASWEGRPIYYVKISDHVNKAEGAEAPVLYTGVHHAREGLSMMNLIYFMDYVLEHYSTDAGVRRIVDNCELYFVPCVNPDGYVYNQTTHPNGGGMWRKNRRNDAVVQKGVDLNRNYGYQWGLNNGSSGSQSSDTYRGPAAFSEPESQAIKALAIQKNFIASVHHHSYAEILFYPWDYTDANCSEAALFRQAGDSLTACNHYPVQHGKGSLGYLSSGTTPDWMYGDTLLKAKSYSFTNEIGGNGFWPSRSQIIPLCEEQVLLNMRLAQFALRLRAQQNTGSPVPGGGKSRLPQPVPALE